MKLSTIAAAAVLATTAVLSPASPAIANPSPVPAFAFDDCPALPADSQPAAWRCEEMHASGTITIGATTLPVVLKTTHAEGPGPDGRTQFVFGTLRSAPVRVPLSTTRLTLEYAGYIDFRQGPPLAEIIDLKYRVRSPLVRPTCYLGTDAQPIRVVGAVVGERVPLPDNPRVLRFMVQDPAFAVPASHGCGPLGRLIDRRFDLPATGSLQLTVYFSIRPYDQL